MDLIQQLEQEEIARLGKNIPDFAPGDTVVVSVNVVEGSRKRAQAYEGVVIARRNRGLNSNFIVRKISSGEGVERTFQLYSPLIASIVDLTAREVDSLRRGGHASTRASDKVQVVRTLMGQVGELFLEPVVAAIWERIGGDTEDRPTIRITVSSHSLSGLRPAMSIGRVMFSRADSVGSRLNAWKMKPILSRRSRVSCLSLSEPSSVSPMRTDPEENVSSPATQCISVDLPDPEGPMIAVNSACWKAMETRSRATTRVSPWP